MIILRVVVEGGDGNSYTMVNPIFKVKHPDGSEVLYDLEVSGMEVGKDRRIIVLKPIQISKDVSKGG